MSKFKDRLWRDLVREHGAQLAQIDRPAARHSRRARPRVLAGTTLGLAGAGTVVALVLSAASSSPAFAVTRNRDGTVSVALQALAAIPDANAKLAGSGLPAKLVQVKAGCGVANGKVPPAVAARLPEKQLLRRRVPLPARFDPRKIPAGKTLVLAAWRAGHAIRVTPAHLISGVAPACLPPPPPPMPAKCRIAVAPPPGNAGNSGNSPNSSTAGSSANSGTTGNSGNSATTGTSTVSCAQVPVPAVKAHGALPPGIPPGVKGMACVASGPRPLPRKPGNGGNSGNS